MQIAAKPLNEHLRLKELYSYDILDTENETAYDELVEMAAYVCNCPIAAISFVDKERQWLKAEKNMKQKEGARKDSFCSHTILQKKVMVIEDPKNDERFINNPLVNGDLNIGFYAGAPIISSSGFLLGAVCVIDNDAKKIDEKQIHFLEAIAKQVSKLLDLRIKNQKDKYHAQEKLLAEKKIAHLNFEKREEENYRTAYLLHEKIAQTLVAIKFYINFARSAGSMGDHYLEKSVNEIIILTDTITSLSKSITPTTYDHDNYAVHIKELALYFGRQHKMTIHFEHEGSTKILEGQLGLLTFRIVQDALILAQHCNAKKINILLKTKDKIAILFYYDGNTGYKNLSEECKMLQTNIINRVGMLGGKITQYTYQQTENRIKIDIPFHQE